MSIYGDRASCIVFAWQFLIFLVNQSKENSNGSISSLSSAMLQWPQHGCVSQTSIWNVHICAKTWSVLWGNLWWYSSLSLSGIKDVQTNIFFPHCCQSLMTVYIKAWADHKVHLWVSLYFQFLLNLALCCIGLHHQIIFWDEIKGILWYLETFNLIWMWSLIINN